MHAMTDMRFPTLLPFPTERSLDHWFGPTPAVATHGMAVCGEWLVAEKSDHKAK